MHKIGTFTVHDQKAQAFLPPFFALNKDMAIRSFQESVNDPTHPFSRSPADYTLFELNMFNQETGQFDKEDIGPISHGNGIIHQRG